MTGRWLSFALISVFHHRIEPPESSGHNAMIKNTVTNSQPKARLLDDLRCWALELVVSDPSYMRRLSWTWRRAFEGSGLAYSLVASSPADWKPDSWWRDEKSGAAVILEYIKIAYYLAKY